MEKKWSKIWKEFNNWCDKHGVINWDYQQRKLSQLVHAEFPNVNTRKLWAYFNSKCNKLDNKMYTLSWRRQQNIIKSAVKTQE